MRWYGRKCAIQGFQRHQTGWTYQPSVPNEFTKWAWIFSKCCFDSASTVAKSFSKCAGYRFPCSIVVRLSGLPLWGPDSGNLFGFLNVSFFICSSTSLERGRNLEYFFFDLSGNSGREVAKERHEGRFNVIECLRAIPVLNHVELPKEDFSEVEEVNILVLRELRVSMWRIQERNEPRTERSIGECKGGRKKNHWRWRVQSWSSQVNAKRVL